ncbi:MAG: hypothetical protein ABFC84_02525 [Veillonellales bacterium]
MENLTYKFSPTSTAATGVDELTKQDNGYVLDYDEYNIPRRYDALGGMHPDDIPRWSEFQDAINSSFSKIPYKDITDLLDGLNTSTQLVRTSLLPVIAIGAIGTENLFKFAKSGKVTNSIQGSSKVAEKLGQVVKTDYGPAVQSTEGEALKLREYVDSGGNLYKAGTFGRSNAADSQFWATENPLTTPGYANKYGVDFSKVDYIIGGKIKKPYITRSAPGLGENAGGALEVVTDPFGVELDFFYMP